MLFYNNIFTFLQQNFAFLQQNVCNKIYASLKCLRYLHQILNFRKQFFEKNGVTNLCITNLV